MFGDCDSCDAAGCQVILTALVNRQVHFAADLWVGLLSHPRREHDDRLHVRLQQSRSWPLDLLRLGVCERIRPLHSTHTHTHTHTYIYIYIHTQTHTDTHT